ncbi:MAG: hypothetical protein LBG84_01225 [Treponema sp.]|jgi:hypothetical protein|nr:hypothetical protein [Treponema sp.]
MANKDYLPHGDSEFLEWVKNLYAYCLANYSRFQIPSPQAALGGLLGDFETAWEAFLAPNHGHVDTTRKNETKAALEKAVRSYCMAWILHNPNVTPQDRTAMNIPLYDHTRTPHGEPDTRPEFAVEVVDIRRLKLVIRDFGTTRVAIPEGFDGAVVHWGFFAAPPASPDMLPRSELTTTAHHSLIFDEEDRGKTVYIALRWQRRGKKGPWSEVAAALVP